MIDNFLTTLFEIQRSLEIMMMIMMMVIVIVSVNASVPTQTLINREYRELRPW